MGTADRPSLVRTGVHQLTIGALAVLATLAVAAAAVYVLNARNDQSLVALRATQSAEQIGRELALHRVPLEKLAASANMAEIAGASDEAPRRRWVEEAAPKVPHATALALVGAANQPATDAQSRCEMALARSGATEVPSFLLAVPVGSAERHTGVLCAAFGAQLLEAMLAEVVVSDERASMHDRTGRVLARIGDFVGQSAWLTSSVTIPGSAWGLELARPKPSHFRDYVMAGTAVAAFAVVPVLLAFSGLGVLRQAASDIGKMREFLRTAGVDGFFLDPPECRVEETATLLPTVQRIFADLRKQRDAINELSFSDSLTRLPTRQYFFKMFSHAFELAKRGSDICLLLIEVSDFARANDLLGAAAGDEILCMAADTLRAQTRKSDFGGRLGAYRFAAIFYNAKGHLMRNRLAQIQQDFAGRQKASATTGTAIHCRLTCGLTYVDREQDERPEDALTRAESALHAAKAIGGNHIEIVLPAPQAKPADPKQAAQA